MRAFSPGDHIIATNDLYGGSVRYLNHVAQKNGIAVDCVDTGNTETVKQCMAATKRGGFCRDAIKPDDADYRLRLSRIYAPEWHTAYVDNTFLTPIFQRPLESGADIVLHSGTKYLGGHNDTLAGFLVTADSDLSERLRFLYKTIGACLAPWDSYLILRGIKTLAIRMERITENAVKIAEWLSGHRKVRAVHYAGKGGMISFEVDRAETARNVLSSVKTILYAESLGGVESLITYPILQTHADVPEDVREALGINDRLMRLSVGIEDVNDLIYDLEEALR